MGLKHMPHTYMDPFGLGRLREKAHPPQALDIVLASIPTAACLAIQTHVLCDPEPLMFTVCIAESKCAAPQREQPLNNVLVVKIVR